MIGLRWKMGFSPYTANPPMKLSSVEKQNVSYPPKKLSSVEKQNVHYPRITFNNVPAKRVQSHKHLGLSLGAKLDFH